MKFIAFALLGFASVAAAQNVSFTINPSQASSISPYIYGINGTINSSGFNNLTLTRAGGNRWTAYNWTNNYSNAGSDWFYENDNALDSSTTPAGAVAGTVQNAMSNSAAALLTIPIAGYVSKDAAGGNADVRYYPGTTTFDPNWLSDRFLPSAAAKPGGPASFSTNSGTLQAETTVYQDEYVNYLKTQYPAAFTANSATPIWFDLDNEPDLWTSTHAELRPVVPGSVTASNPLGTPTPLTYTELLNDTVAYATAVKNVAPNSLIFGPASYGWNGFVNLQNAPDSGAKGDFLTYYLNQTAAASQTAGKRLVDALDLHWYPEATGAGIRITTQDAGYSGSTLAQLQAARVAAPRSLWDPTYVETSWITSSLGNQAIQLIPREQAKMTAAANSYGAAYAANKLSISEYDYGGGDDISGGIAEADALGVFASHGVFSAALWPLDSNMPFTAGGMAMFRNYDGKGGTFGDISLGAVSNSVSGASIYASDYSTNSARMTLVAINKSTGNLTLQLPLPNAPDGQAFAQAAIYDLTAASSTPQFVENVVITNPANFSYTMPGYSVTTFALTTGTVSVWSAAVSGSWSVAGNWTGGVPNAVGAIAAINMPTTAAVTITLDKPQTVGLLELGNSASATVGYTLSGTGANTLTFNNGGNGATISVTDGAHAINAPVVLVDNLQVTGNNSGWTLSFGGAPSGSGSITGGYGLTMGGNGTVILSGQNTYTGVTTLSSGILNLGSAENAGTSGPLGKSAAANPNSIVFNGGTLQYSASNTHDYSGRFSAAANQPYSVDTNGQNVTWSTALTASGGSLAKIGNGTLTLAAADKFTAANVSGGGVSVSGGTIGAFNLNMAAGTSAIGAGTAVTMINIAAGGVAISGGTIGTLNLNTGAGASAIAAGAAVTTINVSAGGVAVGGGTIGSFNLNTGAGTSTIGAGANVATTTVNAGTVSFNSTRPNGTLALPATTTGTVIVGPASGGLLPTVATADFSSTPVTGTVNAANPLAITGTLKLPGDVMATISNGASFTATGANLASTSIPSTLGLGGGTLTFPSGGAQQSIAVHWSGYGGGNLTNVIGADGVVLNSRWTNVGTNWYSGSASNLLTSTGGTTTAAVNSQGPSGAGTYWQVYNSGYALANGGNVDNVIVGPGGGDGDLASAITGIPYSNYEIIAYANDTNGAANMNMWLDGNPASSNSTNAPRGGTNVYFGATVNTSTGRLASFVPITNTAAGTYPAGNYTVWSGLSGSSQTIWLQNDGGDGNIGITGFEIVSAAGPASVNLSATAISATSSSTLDFGETAPASHYQTLSGLSLTAGSAGGTQLRLQNGLNISFNGISAIYPAGGAGARTASIAAGSTSPVISLAGGSSVNVDPNVTLTIGLPIGDPQTGATTLLKTGSGSLILGGTANTYSGGTTVMDGTLILTNPGAIESGTSLTVGDAATFSPVLMPTAVVAGIPAEPSAAASASVPEPSTLALLIAGAALLAIYRNRH